MPKSKKTQKSLSNYDYVAMCLQGGGAMGAYQVGVIKALLEAGYEPNWYVGTSIGAINSAIAAGNEPEDRMEQLHRFWDAIATPAFIDESLLPNDTFSRRVYHYFSSQLTMMLGQPGFFTPHWLNPFMFSWFDKTISYYDTSPLHDTLERFVDFDRINSGHSRLSVGAVEVESGKMTYFDSEKIRIGPEHIMASGALPSGFPSVEIDGKHYWDGGISTNSPVDYALSDHRPQALLCFMVHLFDSYGLNPQTLDDVEKRKKDIEYSSRFEKIVSLHHEIHALRYKIHKLAEELPANKKKSDYVQKCLNNGWDKTVSLVRFLYAGEEDDLSSKDYEFSKRSVKEHIQTGYQDGIEGIKASPWLKPVPKDDGIAIYDLSQTKKIRIGK